MIELQTLESVIVHNSNPIFLALSFLLQTTESVDTESMTVFHSSNLSHLLNLFGQPYRHQKTLTASEVLFRHRPYHQVRKEEIFKFCQSTEGKSQSRADHARFFSGGLNLTRRRVRARGALSNNALPPRASPDAV
ncbi:hypothetical protein CK203_081415 [Vitis vinifera]|uniref:Uncharacterized protein n=1 Tax=Vitis vinifera TaxID=29760 RepID=A0A438DGC1_VITVI|nr:hypothetical protein CK203_081415 [Vitis vinifera]